MALSLTTATEGVETLLGDASNVKWSTGEIAFGLRQALGEVSLAAGQALRLSGLDGAAETSLPETLEAALVSGAAGFCAAIRVGARADWESQAEGEPGRLREWGRDRLSEFRAQVKQAYGDETRMHSQRTSSAPWAKWADDFGEIGKDDLD